MSLNQITAENYLEKRHKAIFTSVVMPVIGVLTVALAATNWRNTPDFYLAMAISVTSTLINIALSYKSHLIHTPFGLIDSRSDGFDTIRWCVNLAIDLYIFYAMQLDSAVALLGWVIMSFGAMSEVYERKYRVITAAFSLFGFLVLLKFYNLTFRHEILAMFACGSILYIFNRFEEWLVNEMSLLAESNQARQKIEFEAELLKREAVLGSQSRSICHEINNALTIIRAQSEFMANSFQNQDDPNRVRVDRIKRGVGQLMKLTSVVLDDLGNDKNVERDYPLSELVIDFRSLLVKHFMNGGSTKFEFHAPDDINLQGLTFRERTGTSYLIAHNLVKNAIEACKGDDASANATVSLSIDLIDNGYRMVIRDNGPGMSDAMKKNILDKTQNSTKSTGHGLGMKFVVDEVRKNNMTLEIKSNYPRGTVVEVCGPLQKTEAPTGFSLV